MRLSWRKRWEGERGGEGSRLSDMIFYGSGKEGGGKELVRRCKPKRREEKERT